MTQADLAKRWREWFPGSPAFAHVARHIYSPRWLRIHSLPESKRYAESEAEYRELLNRHNQVAGEVLGSECYVLYTRFRFTEDAVRPELLPLMEELAETSLTLVPELGFIEEDEPEFARVAEIFAGEGLWQEGRFDRLIRAVADDRVQWFMFVDKHTGEAYAPYDGGADLFYETQERRDRMRKRYSGWLSQHAEGL